MCFRYRYLQWTRRLHRILVSQEALWSLSQLVRTKSKPCVLVCLVLLVVYSGFQVAYMPVEMNICPDPLDSSHWGESVPEDNNITIVTMYLNLGTHSQNFLLFSRDRYATDQYRAWLQSWGKLQNKVVAFFDDEEFIRMFRKIRSHFPESWTQISRVSQAELPAFRHKPRVEEILADPSFTPSYPADYTCTMDAKYDALERALRQGLVTSKYVAWMDIGLWRKLHKDEPPYSLKIPPDFNSSRVGFSEVTQRSLLKDLSPVEVYRQNVVWVAGGFVLGTQKVLAEFIIAYKRTVEELLAMGLADTDQQVVTSMYSPAMLHRQKVQVMTYACPRGSFGLFGHAYLYFCLPYICRASSTCSHRSTSNVGSQRSHDISSEDSLFVNNLGSEHSQVIHTQHSHEVDIPHLQSVDDQHLKVVDSQKSQVVDDKLLHDLYSNNARISSESTNSMLEKNYSTNT